MILDRVIVYISRLPRGSIWKDEDMGNQSTTDLAKRGGTWHIDKMFRGTRIRESTSTGAGFGGTKRAI